MLKPISKDSTSRFTALVIGEAGIGKTSLLRTLPEAQRTCVLSAEGGLLCVADLVSSGRVEGYEITSLKDFKDAYTLLCQEDQKEQYQWIFIDSLTEISSRCTEAMKEKYPNKADSFNLWGEYTDTLTLLIKGFRDLQPYNVVFTCLVSMDKDESNRRYYGPDIAGSQIKARLTSYFDLVLFMNEFQDDEGNPYRAFITQPWQRYSAKDRSGKLTQIEKPDLTYLQNKIFNADIPF